MSTTVRDIYEFIDSIAPFRTQESWDNSGFLVGDVSKEVTKVAVCLDVTHDTLQKAADFGADLLVSHHPVIFHPMKGLREQTPGTEAIVYDAIRKDIAVLSAHTCWDLAEGGVNDVLAKLVGLENVEGVVPDENGNCMVRKGSLKTAVPAEEYADVVAEALDTLVRLTLPEKMIRTVLVPAGPRERRHRRLHHRRREAQRLPRLHRLRHLAPRRRPLRDGDRLHAGAAGASETGIPEP